MKIKKLSSILIFVLLISCLAGCGSKTQPKQEVSIPEDYKGLMSYLKGQAKSDELTCWYTSEDDKAWIEAAAKNFEKEYNVKVKLVYYDGVSLF